MAKTDVMETGLLALIFQAATFAGLAQQATASPVTNLYVSLHTADPGEAATQTTSEGSYSGYARVAVARTAAGWAVTAASVSPAADVVFPAGTAGATSGPATFFGVGTDPTGAGRLLYRGPIAPSITFGDGVTPRLPAATFVITES